MENKIMNTLDKILSDEEKSVSSKEYIEMLNFAESCARNVAFEFEDRYGIYYEYNELIKNMSEIICERFLDDKEFIKARCWPYSFGKKVYEHYKDDVEFLIELIQDSSSGNVELIIDGLLKNFTKKRDIENLSKLFKTKAWNTAELFYHDDYFDKKENEPIKRALLGDRDILHLLPGNRCFRAMGEYQEYAYNLNKDDEDSLIFLSYLDGFFAEYVLEHLSEQQKKDKRFITEVLKGLAYNPIGGQGRREEFEGCTNQKEYSEHAKKKIEDCEKSQILNGLYCINLVNKVFLSVDGTCDPHLRRDTDGLVQYQISDKETFMKKFPHIEYDYEWINSILDFFNINGKGFVELVKMTNLKNFDDLISRGVGISEKPYHRDLTIDELYGLRRKLETLNRENLIKRTRAVIEENSYLQGLQLKKLAEGSKGK